MEEYLKFVQLHNIDREIADEIYIKEVTHCKECYGALATPFVIGRNALFQLRIITGIKY